MHPVLSTSAKEAIWVLSCWTPLNEVLAAGMVLLLSGWDRQTTLVDMCGFSTLLIEAALLARQCHHKGPR